MQALYVMVDARRKPFCYLPIAGLAPGPTPSFRRRRGRSSRARGASLYFPVGTQRGGGVRATPVYLSRQQARPALRHFKERKMAECFGTHNFWAAFRGWLWARITWRKNVSWKTHRSKHQFPYHVVNFD